MGQAAISPDFLAVVRPRLVLLRTGTLSYILLSIPLFGALYAFGIPNGSWPIVLVFQLITLLVVAICYRQYRRTYIGVTGDSIYERGFFGRSDVTPLSSIQLVVLVRTYRSSSTETFHQLLVSDSQENRVLRMRGMFWSKTDMRAVVNAGQLSLTDREDPMTPRAFFDEFPGSAYWFENRPVLVILAVLVVTAVVLAVTLSLMMLMGIPLAR